MVRIFCLFIAFVFSGCCLLAHGAETEWLGEKFSLSPGTDWAISSPSGLKRFDLEINAAISGNKTADGVGKVSWGVEFRDSDGVVNVRVAILWGNSDFGSPFDRRFMRVKVDSISSGGKASELLCRDFEERVELFGGYNCLSIELFDGTMNIWVGSGAQCYVGAVRCGHLGERAVLTCNRKLKVDYVAWRSDRDPADDLSTGIGHDDLVAYLLQSRDPVEGFWNFLDRDTDSRWSETGGRYRLAIVRHDSYLIFRQKHSASEDSAKNVPAYCILFVDGAEVNRYRWIPGMIKGYLYPTIFENHYTLEWYDAMMEPIVDEVTADIVDEAILRFNFPLYHATIRFSKEM